MVDPRKAPWMSWRVGQRVTLRYRAEDGLHDALGYLTEVHADRVTVDTRRGEVTVHASQMVIGRLVHTDPPPKIRRRSP